MSAASVLAAPCPASRINSCLSWTLLQARRCPVWVSQRMARPYAYCAQSQIQRLTRSRSGGARARISALGINPPRTDSYRNLKEHHDGHIYCHRERSPHTEKATGGNELGPDYPHRGQPG